MTPIKLAVSLSLLLTAPTWGASVERIPSCARVRAVAFEGPAAVVTAEDGSCRFDLAESVVSSSSGPVVFGGCQYSAHEQGVLRRCSRLADEVLSAGGFPVTSLAVYGGTLYAGTFGGGLRHVPSGSRVSGIPDAVTALASAEQGLLVGTERGSFILSGGRVSVLGAAGPADGHVVRILRGGSALWAAHFDRGLSRLQDGVWRSWGAGDGLPSEWLDDLAWDGDKLWGATEKGVFWMVGDRVVRPSLSELTQATASVFFSSGTMYLAQAGRVLAFKDGAVVVMTMPEQHPQRLLAADGVIWVAGLDGLWKLSEGAVTRYGVIDGRLAGDWVTALAAGPSGLLVGTYDAGLAVLGSSVSLKADAWVNLGALALDGQRVAVGETAAGLSVWDGTAWSKYRAADGLPGEDVSAVCFDGPDLWVGTRTGLARVRF